MGKVYDALQKAEAQRPARSAASVRPSEAVMTGGVSPVRDRGESLLDGLLRRLRGQRKPAAEDGTSINKRRIALLHPDSFVAEQFRSLRARLDSLAAQRPLRTLAIASALPGEGKTTAAVNLALVSSMAVGRRVLLVDCDLRKPKVHTALGLRPELGLAEILAGQATPDRAILKVEGCELHVLPVRGTPSNPSELLGSERMRTLLEELARGYDQVILDMPPTLGLPDAKALSELVDGVVLVVRADETPQEDVEAALDVLDRQRILGVVLNGAVTDSQRYGY